MARQWWYEKGGTGTVPDKEQYDNNIMCIYGELSTYGWTPEAIAGAIGCFYAESNLNPAIFETSHQSSLDENSVYFAGGVGLAQWTDYPAYTAQYPNPLLWSAKKENKNWWDGNFQCWLMNKCDDDDYTSMGYGEGPRWGWQQDSSYPSISFNNFKSLRSVNDACTYWFYCFEWHYHSAPDGYVSYRKQWAEYAYQLIKGQKPEPPEGGGGGGGGSPGEKKSKKKLWFYIRRQFI